MKLHSVTVRDSVFVSAPSETTLVCATVDLEFDEGTRCVVAKPHNGKAMQMIPLENVRCMTPLTDELQAAIDAKKKQPSLNGLVGLSPAEVKKREEAATARRETARVGVV